MKLFNSLTRQVEEFVSLKKDQVGMYTCGPTVYDYPHIGHGRKYVMDDLLRRALVYNGYKVTHVQNITDVGHLVSDADEGVDKMEKGAERMKKTVWEVAEFYAAEFFADMDKLNTLRPDISCKATDHITEQIEIIKKLIDKGFAYETVEAVYFDVGKFPRYSDLFGQRLEDKQTAVREEVRTGEHKRHPADFALWFKRIGRFAGHQMHWDSPWGDGFPGWHIECSAMAMKYLGETVDIHTGGLEHMAVHHPNEIAQSEAATGKPFVRYFLHYGHLLIDGQKMAKSAGNFLRVGDVIEKGFSPSALRYLYMTAHYRTPLNFTWSALAGAQTAYDRINDFVKSLRAGESKSVRTNLSEQKLKKIDQFRAKFLESVNNDLNFPQGLAVVWEMLKSNIPDHDKLELLLDWDQVLGLNLASASEVAIPDELKKLVYERESLRKSGKFVEADELRLRIEKLGFSIKDTAHGTGIQPKQTN